jgi:hypothetical protein
MERESVLHGINSLQSFETLPLKSNGQIKTLVRTTENYNLSSKRKQNTYSRLIHYISEEL